MFFRKSNTSNDGESVEQQHERKFQELKASMGPLSGRSLQYCSDACLKRYLEARSWNVEKSKKMLEESLRWRSSFKPEEIRWVREMSSSLLLIRMLFPIYINLVYQLKSI
ncbi:hypothetical protein OROMI_016120 [Orobanche minor]